jgi:FKBP-type peptidyl-prolyl cis-trans isomerase FklB
MKVLTLALSSALLLAACSSSESKKEPAPAKPIVTSATKAPTAAADGSRAMTTASGLRYKVLASGPAGGVSPTVADTVVVHYRGTLVDGTEFDSSYSRGQPATFGVGQVIRGWTEALQLMKPGDKWLIHIPYNLAYGMQGSPPKIPPFADLVFQVELLQVLH